MVSMPEGERAIKGVQKMKPYELSEPYPLERIAGTEPPHDISKGLKRAWPIAYDEIGVYRERRLVVPWGWVAIVVGGFLIARVL